jgi:uncharacterized protein (TIGR03000 family)
MYSVVLMVAMTTSPAIPDFGRRGCSGCSGASGWYGGCSGCWGGYGGYGGYGCSGCYGYGGYRGYGSYGGYYRGSYGTPSMGSGYYGTMPYTGGMSYFNEGTPLPAEQSARNLLQGDETSAPATLLVSLPSDAKLTVGGAPTTSTSSERWFLTPSLPRGQDFFYELRAEVERNGKKEVATQRVRVQAGRETRVDLFPATESITRK